MRSKKPTLNRLIELHKLLLNFRAIERLVYIPGQDAAPENDVDHSYTLAMMAWYLAPHFPELNAHKILQLALAHDLVEIHSGDTDVFDAQKVATKPARERAARLQLKRDWPDFIELHENLEEYVERQTPEAKFVYALDKILPIILNYLGAGQGWIKHKTTLAELHEVKKDRVTEHPAIAEYYAELYELLVGQPELFYRPGRLVEGD